MNPRAEHSWQYSRRAKKLLLVELLHPCPIGALRRGQELQSETRGAPHAEAGRPTGGTGYRGYTDM